MKFEIKKGTGKRGKHALREGGFSTFKDARNGNFAWANFDNSILFTC